MATRTAGAQPTPAGLVGASDADAMAHRAGQVYGPGRGVWSVSDPAKAAVFGSFFSVNAAFFMGLFFLLSAYFVPASFDRKGPAIFLKDRFVRLGAPLVVIPLIGGLAGLALDPRHGGVLATVVAGMTAYADSFASGERSPAGCTPPVTCALGHLWFVEQLLLYVVLYAAWRRLTRRGSFAAPPAPSDAALVGHAVALAAVTFVVRIHYPINRWVDLFGSLAAEVGHLPHYASLFVVGLLAARGRWLEKMPTRRGIRWLGIGVACAALRYLLPIGAHGPPTGPLAPFAVGSIAQHGLRRVGAFGAIVAVAATPFDGQQFAVEAGAAGLGRQKVLATGGVSQPAFAFPAAD